MNLILGVDTGVTGAWAMLDSHGTLVACEDMPIIRDAKTGWTDAAAWVPRLVEYRGGNQLHATVERTHAMPGNGSQAAFSQGATLGSTLAALQAVGARIALVTPGSWKKAMGLSSDKQASLDKARLLFPSADLDRKKDHNKAEALLIGEYGRRQAIGTVAA